MGKWILTFILLNIFLVGADQSIFAPGKGILIDDKNITLIKIDERTEKVLFCVNGIHGIIEEERSRTINGVSIDVERVATNRVVTDIDYKCRNCICDKECDNSACFKKVEELSFPEEEVGDEEPEETIDKIVIVKKDITKEVIESADIEIQSIIIALLIVFIVILGLIVLWRKR